MPINVRDFKYHEAVVYDLIAHQSNPDGADTYVDKVAMALAEDAQNNPNTTEAIDDLRGLTKTLKALDSAAGKHAMTLDEYLHSLGDD